MASLEYINGTYELLRENLKTAGMDELIETVDALQAKRYYNKALVKLPEKAFTPAPYVVFPGEETFVLESPDNAHIVPAVNRLVYLSGSEPARSPLPLVPDSVHLDERRIVEILLLAGVPRDIHTDMIKKSLFVSTPLRVDVSLRQRAGRQRPFGSNAWRLK